MPFLFACTLFVSAALLFVVQPLIAKMLLPRLGGASSVWTTCMVFYQVVLLAGYLYAHLVSRRFNRRTQVIMQLALLVVAFLPLPFAITETAEQRLAAGAGPIGWLLGQLALVAGLPFFAVSTTGPLLQRWFSQTGDARADDPYFLYSASNLGSLLALAAFPLWLEDRFRLAVQAELWRWAFVGLALLIAACGVGLLRAAPPAPAGPKEPGGPTPTAISWARRMRWILWAFIPSSLMLGVTTYLTTDIASIPLLWVVPLGLYLLTFILAFARHEYLPVLGAHWLVPALAVALVFAMLGRATEPAWLLMTLHLSFLFVAALVCHTRLARDRPEPVRLTEFYVCLSVGGALGGIVNALAAPLLFREVLEYPFVILLACLLYVPRAIHVANPTSSHWKWALVLVVAALPLVLGPMSRARGWPPIMLTYSVIYGLPVTLCFAFARDPRRFTTALAAVWMFGQFDSSSTRPTLFVDRSFFGVSRVTRSANGLFRQLDHGNTRHGRQFIAPGQACESLVYYHRTGPLGRIFKEFNLTNAAARVGLIGLGAGATLTYAQAGQAWDVYEIDPLVVRIARDKELFTFLSDCTPVTPRIIEGDGRLQLAHAPAGHYGLLILDAFSSDAIPMHLLTAEAVELYFEKIAEGGWLALHISNRYLDLEQILAGLAQAKGYAGLSWIDTNVLRYQGKSESHWVLLARHEADLRGLATDPNRIPLESRPTTEPWTDARSSLLPVFKW